MHLLSLQKAYKFVRIIKPILKGCPKREKCHVALPLVVHIKIDHIGSSLAYSNRQVCGLYLDALIKNSITISTLLHTFGNWGCIIHCGGQFRLNSFLVIDETGNCNLPLSLLRLCVPNFSQKCFFLFYFHSDSPPVDLYLIFEKSSSKNQVRRTGFLACKNQF